MEEEQLLHGRPCCTPGSEEDGQPSAVSSWRSRRRLRPSSRETCPDPAEIERHTEEALDQTLREVLRDQAAGVRRVVKGGDPATVLLKRVQPSDLLVVGARGHSRGFGGMPMGSVSEKCVRQAPCSVVVVRPIV